MDEQKENAAQENGKTKVELVGKSVPAELFDGTPDIKIIVPPHSH